MKKALLITAHKSPMQLRRLIKAVECDEMSCFVHVDGRVDIEPFKRAVAGFNNVVFTTRRYPVSLEHSFYVQAILSAAQLAQATGDYKYYISLTGQCYPLADNSTINNTLDSLYPLEIIDSTAVDAGTWCAGWGKWQKMENARAFLLHTLGVENYEKLPGKIARLPVNIGEYLLTKILGRPKNIISNLGYTYAAGSSLFILSDRSMNFILERSAGDKSLLKAFRSISTPEESFFQTVLTASPFHENFASIAKHHISEKKEIDRMECSGILRFICNARGEMKNLRHPLVITMQEKDLITKSRALFGRKFDEKIDSEIIDYIDKLRTLSLSERIQLSGASQNQ